MGISERVLEADRKFKAHQQERERLLQQADEYLIEMHKLQGEWRVLKELEEEKQPPDADPAATIKVKSAKEPK